MAEFDPGQLDQLEDALELAKLSEPDEFAGPPDPSELSSRSEWADLDTFDDAVGDISADEAMQRALDETDRRRRLQEAYNEEHGIVPRTIVKSIEQVMDQTVVVTEKGGSDLELREQLPEVYGETVDRDEMIARLEREMLEAAEKLDFELAASLRDRVFELRASGTSGVVAAKPTVAPRRRKSAHARRRARR